MATLHFSRCATISTSAHSDLAILPLLKGSFGNYMTMAHLEGLRNKCGWGAAFRQVSNWWIPFDNDANLSVQSMSVQSKQCLCDLAKVHMVAQRGIAHLMACWD